MKKENLHSIFGEVSKSKIDELIDRIEKIGLDIEKDIEEIFVKGGGKGGQKRNKTNNTVMLKYIPLGIVVRCGRTRSLSLNRFFALRQLLEKLEKLSIKRREKMKILDGKVIAEEIHFKTKELSEMFYKKVGRKPSLAIVNYFENSPSSYYMRLKIKKALSLGIDTKVFMPDDKTDKKGFLKLIDELNNDRNIDAIMVERPLPDGFDDYEFWDILSPSKDVDCISSVNMGRLFITRDFKDIESEKFFVPQTALACIKIIKYYGIDVKGMKVCVVGRSSVVGKPLAHMLSLMDATVTLCHSKTKEISWHLKNSDMICVAIGKGGFIKGDMIGKDQIIIDVGTNLLDDGRLVGDVDFESVKDSVSAITPVPGGVGPLTLACLLNASVKAGLKLYNLI